MRYPAFLLLLLLPTAALAHPGHGPGVGDSFAHGLAHPLLGADHLIAMVAIGVLAALSGGRARWAVPGAFLTGMAVFGLIGVGGAESALAEHVIIASIILLGVAIAVRKRLPAIALAAMAVVFGAAHGYAHGSEGTGDLGYLVGFMLSTAALHGAGYALGHLIASRPQLVTRGTGGAIALAGLALSVA